MNIWNPQYENWAGKFYPESLPAFAFYDWVSYYTYTPGSGNYGTDNNFTFSWIDNFDSWDTTKWDKATHTFPGNNCDFIQENAVFQDGKLNFMSYKQYESWLSGYSGSINFMGKSLYK